MDIQFVVHQLHCINAKSIVRLNELVVMNGITKVYNAVLIECIIFVNIFVLCLCYINGVEIPNDINDCVFLHYLHSLLYLLRRLYHHPYIQHH